MNRFVFSHTGIALTVIFFISCTSIPRGHFQADKEAAPDYSLEKNWAALPSRLDSADVVPVPGWRDEQDTAPVDVFYIHPTTYTGKSGQRDWNSSLDDDITNLRTDRIPIKYQASIFNGAGKVYAPRYRQAHLHCFYSNRKKDAEEALELAYADVRQAFLYYLEHYNEGRPFILAAHSQGTVHGKLLLREIVDGHELQQQLVVAYLVGFTVKQDEFKSIQPCSRPEETGCFCSWRTFRQGYVPAKLHFPDANIVVTHPITWSVDHLVSEKEAHQGCVLRDFHKVYPKRISAVIYEDLLWINKPRFPGSIFFTSKNYHIADYNFFYADIRQNAQVRAKAFFMKG